MKLKAQSNRLFLIVVVCTMFFHVGCASMGKRLVGKGAPPVIDTAITKIMDMENADLAREGLPTAVLLVSVLAETAPKNMELLTQTAFLYVALGICVEDEKPKYASKLYSSGYDYGLRALKTNKKFRKGLASGKKISEMVSVLDEKYTATLMWTALGAGLDAMLNLDDPTSMMVLAPCLAMVKRSIELDENYYYGLGNLFMAAYASVMPKLLDASCGPEKSQMLFQKVKGKNQGKFLLADVFEARYLISLKNDKDKFKERLQYVLDTDSGVLKGRKMFNEIAKMKAAYSLANMREYF